MNTYKNISFPILFIFVFLIAWEGIVRLGRLPGWLLPAPSEVTVWLIAQLPLMLVHSQQTLIEAIAGFAAALGASVLLVVLMDASPAFRQGIYPLLIMSQTIPIVSIAPLFIIWFGYGVLPKIIVVALVCFFPIVINLADGIKSVDPDMVNLLKVMGASRWQILKMVRIPAALPSFFSGLKIAGTYSIMGAVIGEWLGASKGLGVFMTRATHSYQMDAVFSAIVIITVLSLLLFALIELAARGSMPWHYKSRK